MSSETNFTLTKLVVNSCISSCRCVSCPEDPQRGPDPQQSFLWQRRLCAAQVQCWLLPPWWLCRGDSDLSGTGFLEWFTALYLWVKFLKSAAHWQLLNIWCSNQILFFFPGESEGSGGSGSGSTPVINHGRVTAGQKPSYSVGDFITIECYSGYTLNGDPQIQYVGNNQWLPGVPTCQLSKCGCRNPSLTAMFYVQEKLFNAASFFILM